MANAKNDAPKEAKATEKPQSQPKKVNQYNDTEYYEIDELMNHFKVPKEPKRPGNKRNYIINAVKLKKGLDLSKKKARYDVFKKVYQKLMK